MNSITVYGYDRFNGVYTGTIEAYESPLEPGHYLDPAFSCREKPPITLDGFVAVRKADGWVIVPDHRGERWFKPDGSFITISELGEKAIDGLTKESPPVPPPPSRTSLFKTEIYERMTDAELDVFDDAIEQADRRTRLMWRDCIEVEADSPLFPVLQAQMTAAFGEDRAEAILSLLP